MMGKSQLGFKLWLEHILRFDLNYKDLIPKSDSIWDLSETFGDSIKKTKLWRSNCLLTDAKWNAWVIETLLLWVQFNVKTALYYLNGWPLSTVTVRSISCVIRPEIYRIKYDYHDLLLKIYLLFYCCEKMRFDHERFGTWTKMGIWDLDKWFKSWKIRDLS